MAQRLVRTLCPHCKEPTTVDEDMWKTLTHPWKVSGKGTFYKPVGCDECRNTGFVGRIGIYEMMLLDHDLRTQIHSETDSKTIHKLAIKQGMTKMRISGARKVAMGWTTIEEVMKVVPLDEE
jgi:general secretion pathway protein E